MCLNNLSRTHVEDSLTDYQQHAVKIHRTAQVLRHMTRCQQKLQRKLFRERKVTTQHKTHSTITGNKLLLSWRKDTLKQMGC